MVAADIEQSTRGIGSIFEDRDVRSIAVVGGLAAVGFIAALGVGSSVADAIGAGGRADTLALAAGAIVAAIAAVKFLGDGVGGGLAVGALTAVGFAVFGLIFGRGGFNDGYFRSTVARTLDSGMHNAPSFTQGNGMDEDEQIRRVGRPRYRSAGVPGQGQFR